MMKFHTDGTLPKDGEVFVFGSNLAGIHGAGAAKVATSKFGAVYGHGVGWQPNFKSYAIPTKGLDLRFALPLDTIKREIENFVRVTQDEFILNKGYFVTRIGCGFAGYKDEEIAPMFKGARNCSFAEQWRPYLEPTITVDPELAKLIRVVDKSLRKNPDPIKIRPEEVEEVLRVPKILTRT